MGRGADPPIHPRNKVGLYCKDCKNRYPGCQDHCELGQKQKKEWNKTRHLIRVNKAKHKREVK